MKFSYRRNFCNVAGGPVRGIVMVSNINVDSEADDATHCPIARLLCCLSIHIDSSLITQT